MIIDIKNMEVDWYTSEVYGKIKSVNSWPFNFSMDDVSIIAHSYNGYCTWMRFAIGEERKNISVKEVKFNWIKNS